MAKKRTNLSKRCLEIVNSSKKPIDSVSIHKILKAGGVFRSRKYAAKENQIGAVSSALTIYCQKGWIRKAFKKGKSFYYVGNATPAVPKQTQPSQEPIWSGPGIVPKLCLDVINSSSTRLRALQVASRINIPGFAKHYKNKESMVASVFKVLETLADKKLITRVTESKRVSWFHKLSKTETWKYTPKEGKPINIKVTSRVLENSVSDIDIKISKLLEERSQINQDIQSLLRAKELLNK